MTEIQIGVAERREERNKADQAWLRENRAQYRGQWVLLDGGRLVLADRDASKLIAAVHAARALGNVESFMMVRIDTLEEENTPFGGW